MALGVLIYSLLRVIPIFGWLLAFIVIILGVGALWLLYRNRNTATVVDSSVTPAETPVA